MARPTLPIKPDQVVFLARLGMPVVEIAGFFHCDRGTLYKRFGIELRKGRAERILKLREAQWKAAEAGDVRMLIWLGKQELGQSDKGLTRNTVERIESDPRRRRAEGLGAGHL